jgi:hypothetical protein
MKIHIALLASLIFFHCGAWAQPSVPEISAKTKALPPDTAYAVVGRGANQRVWEKISYELGADGKAHPKKHRFIELATGMHYMNANGQWVESQEQINILPQGGAAAVQGQYQVYFPANIYNGVIKLVTPDGQILQCRAAGVSYDDGNQTALVAVLTNSIGRLVSSNQIVYPNAFVGFDADLVCTYRKSGFECDLVFRSRPPAPDAYGLDVQTSKIQLLTEFFNTLPPQQALSSANPSQPDLTDDTLTFGKLTMGHGHAFIVPSSATQTNTKAGLPVYKSWMQIQGHTFLIEQLSYPKLSQDLNALPAAANNSGAMNRNSGGKSFALGKRVIPPSHPIQADTNTILLASADSLQSKGVVLDYTTIISGETNFTFQGDTTYYINGEYSLSGTTTIEGGSIIKNKYAGNTSAIDIDQYGTLLCATAPYRPAIFTSYNDNTVGETISGSSGTPGIWDTYIYLDIYATNVCLHDLRFNHCILGAHQNWGITPAQMDVWNCQFMDVDVAVISYNLGLHNVLIGRFVGYDAAVQFTGQSLVAENVTSDYGGSGFIEADGASASVMLTNCLITGQPILGMGSATIYTNNTAWINYPFTPIYQTVGCGNYYLINGSPYRGAGTTNISPALLAELNQKTTYPPIVYSNTPISTATTFSPQAFRDNTNTVDIGYHYDPVDYMFGGVAASSNLTFTAGTVVGWFELPGSGGPGYGISLPDLVNVSLNGTVTAPCILTRYDTVQEGCNGVWQDKGWLGGIIGAGSTQNDNNAPSIKASFTHFNHLAADPNSFRDYNAPLLINANHCEFYGSDDGYLMTFYLTNCLFVRTGLGLQASTNTTVLSGINLRNCTMSGGSISTTHTNGAIWPVWIENCAFDGTDFSGMDDPSGGNTNITYCNFNAFLTGAGQLPSEGANTITVTNFNWQTSWFGDYYLTTTSPLIDAGSVTADKVGLYHFTTQANQIKETNSVVDIGYHYVATDASGNPDDSVGDGIPDYIADSNGNGLVDPGETPWVLPPVIIAEPQNQTPQVGVNATFSVQAVSVIPITYQWRKGGTNISAATNSTLTIANTQNTNAGSYDVIVANDAGLVQSLPAILVPISISYGYPLTTFTAAGLPSSMALDIYATPNLGASHGNRVCFFGCQGQTTFIVPLPFWTLGFFKAGSADDPDGDGLTSGYEQLVSHSNPYSSDTTGGGIPDGWKSEWGLDPTSNTGINGATGDPDGDGISNLNEYLNGTDPFRTNSNPRPIITITNSGFLPVATSGGSDAIFTVSRTGATTNSLTVSFTIGGTAVYNTDYNLSPSQGSLYPFSLTIPSGSSSATIAVHALNTVHLLESVIVGLVPISIYDNSSPATWAYVVDPYNDRSSAFVSSAGASSDSNGDGIPDLWQFANFGSTWQTNSSAAASADPNGNGFSNYQEYLYGTNPNMADEFWIWTVLNNSSIIP